MYILLTILRSVKVCGIGETQFSMWDISVVTTFLIGTIDDLQWGGKGG